jgi:class 3 adenylate cyclase/8-oxo-dGTP pyrophosphatase MutT (NUDIX family)
MDFDVVLAQIRQLLQRQRRLSYRALRLRFQLDDESLAALKDELIYAERVARDEDNRVLVWVGEIDPTLEPAAQSSPPLQPETVRAEPRAPDAERRQLTVLFCDLVDSTALASQLDPEEWREVVRAYQETCAKVIARFEGHNAQYLGDGLFVYFGYPRAHEDGALRAVRAGLGMMEAVGQLNTRLGLERGIQLAVRLGVHTEGEGRGQGHHAARPCRWLQASGDWRLVTGLLRRTQAMPTPEALSAHVLHRYRIFAIAEQALRLPSGRAAVRQVVQRPGAVVIIPQLEDGRLMLIAQYRFAVGATLLEFPAGTLEPGEAPLDCARRELIEETGYRADHWRALGILYPSPGYCDEKQYLFVATGLAPEHAAGDDDEMIEVKRLTVQEVERIIADGALVDAKSSAAYARAKLQGVLGGMSA